VVLGLLLGIVVIVVFVFKGSESTIDAPRISGIDHGRSAAGPARAGRAPLQLVRVIDGRPPPRGPVRLDFEQGGTARFLVDSDAPVAIEIPGYGVSRTLGQGRNVVAFAARKPGQYPVVVSGSMIDIATMRVARR
jgi:hypothetical protein